MMYAKANKDDSFQDVAKSLATVRDTMCNVASEMSELTESFELDPEWRDMNTSESTEWSITWAKLKGLSEQYWYLYDDYQQIVDGLCQGGVYHYDDRHDFKWYSNPHQVVIEVSESKYY